MDARRERAIQQGEESAQLRENLDHGRAGTVRDAVDELNGVLRKAYEEGLMLRLTIDEIASRGRRDPLPHVTVVVGRLI